MAQKIIFRGAFIRYADIRRAKEGGEVFTRIHMSCDFSDVVREQMEWDDPGDSVKMAKLTGELCAREFLLTPGDKALKQHELEIAINDASDFQVVMLKDEDGEPSGRQLRFIVRSPGDGVEALVGQYIRRVGIHEGQLKISYEPQAKQEVLPGTQVDQQDEDGQEPVSEHLAGEALQEHESRSGSLASASQMQGTAAETARRASRRTH
jgi:hypothetical protein